MSYDLEKFSAGSMDKGVQTRTMDFQSEVTLGIDAYNMSQGIQQGLGPRCGMSPIPGQLDAETISGVRLPGLMAAEGAPAQGFSARRKVLGVYALKLPDPADVTQKITTYAWLVSTVVSSVEYFDIVLSSTYTTYESISSAIYAGFGYTSYATATSLNYFAEAFVPVSGSRVTPLRSFLQYAGDNFLSSVIMSVTGANIPTQWLLGEATATGDATHAPSAAFHKISSVLQFGGVAGVMAGGVPSEYNLANFTTTPREITVYAITAAGGFNIQYAVSIPTPSTSILKGDILCAGTVTLDLAATTAVKVSAGVTYSNTKAALVNDPSSVTNSSYKAILVAGKKPVACIFQDGYRGEGSGNNGKTNQWFDLTQNSFQPRALQSNYYEDGSLKNTSFNCFNEFIRGTAMSGSGPTGTLGAANSGVLRANTVYEFTFSTYNKRLNFETNVGIPVKFQTGTNDFVSLRWFPSVGTTLYQTYEGSVTSLMVAPFSAVSSSTGGLPVVSTALQNFGNHLEYRFYYRQEGTFEWLPALFIDVMQWWFFPWPAATGVFACTGAIAALPGGQAGAFNDYSPLSKDTYTCVVQYKDRAFWISDKQINYSLRNNIFAYPGRNSISAVGGEFRGALIHNYPGQAEQSSRMVIFGTRETYVARFTGQREQANVQVSADTSGVFDIDGSDLVIDPWTSVTAFSYRSAAIAEGILYWWGPQGIFRDDGVQTPTRISTDIEPELFSIYDPNKTDLITANYNNQTKEIEWFFKPKTARTAEVNRSLIFNTVSGNWLVGKYNQQIDWLQAVNVETSIGTSGYREVVGTRLTAAATLQRAYYFDQRNRSGDLAPTKEWMVKTISTPSSGVRRLALAAGYDATNYSTIAVGDYLAFQQTLSYGTSMTLGSDMVAQVEAVNTAYIDITLPAGAEMDEAASLDYTNFVPFWHATPTTAGLNGIPYNMPTAYWLPKGVNGYYFWLWCYLLAKMTLWKCDEALGWTLGYRCPTASGIITDSIAFANNCDGNFQVYHPLRPGEDNHEGQGIKFVLSGNHIGHEWVLQYMEAHATPIKGDTLKRFEG